MRKILFLMICFIFLISGCGSPGGGAEFFETVMVTANCEVTGLYSDIITWKLRDPNGSPDDVCDYYVVWNDNVSVIIKSEVFPIIELETSSDVEIENVRIDYTPADGLTPPLPSKYKLLGQNVEPNKEVSLDIGVITQDQKNKFLSDPNDYNVLIKSDFHYIYHVNLTFSVVELISNKKGEVSTGLTMHLADFLCAKEGEVNCDDDCIPFELHP